MHKKQNKTKQKVQTNINEIAFNAGTNISTIFDN